MMSYLMIKKLILEIGRVIRQGFLQQSAFHSEDTYVPLKKQTAMVDVSFIFMMKR